MPFPASLTAEHALALMTALLAVGAALGALEDLVRYRAFADDGLMSWPVARLGSRLTAGGPAGRVADALFDYRRFRWVLALRLGAAACLLGAPGEGPARAALLFALGATGVAEIVRCPFGQTGAHQMMLVVNVALFFASAAPPGHPVRVVCLWFVALQATLAYVTSGWTKLRSATWRRGRAVVGVMSTTIYGHAGLYRVLRQSRALALAACWATMLFEGAFFLALLGRPGLTLALLASAGLFHLAAAATMGLNLFFWAFVATFPAVWYCSQAPAPLALL